VLRASHSNARFGQSQFAHLSARARVVSHLVRPPCAPRCSARHRTLRVYGSPERECRATKSRRHAAQNSCRAAHQIAVVELLRQHRFAERQLKLVVRIRAPEHADRCDCASACCSSTVSLACISLVVRGVGQRSSERHRRAADKRLLLPVIWLVAERQRWRTADSEREWHTQQVSVFRRGGAGAGVHAHKRGRARRDDTLSQRELPHSTNTGTLKLHVRVVPFELLSSFSTTIADVSQSQI
jgi:hypothetical protein